MSAVDALPVDLVSRRHEVDVGSARRGRRLVAMVAVVVVVHRAFRKRTMWEDASAFRNFDRRPFSASSIAELIL